MGKKGGGRTALHAIFQGDVGPFWLVVVNDGWWDCAACLVWSVAIYSFCGGAIVPCLAVETLWMWKEEVSIGCLFDERASGERVAQNICYHPNSSVKTDQRDVISDIARRVKRSGAVEGHFHNRQHRTRHRLRVHKGGVAPQCSYYT